MSPLTYGDVEAGKRPADIELAVRFCLEVAKAFGRGQCRFHDADEWEALQRRYGSMQLLQTPGRG